MNLAEVSAMSIMLLHPAGLGPEASTDARVYLDLFGTHGQILDLFLRDSGNSFNECVLTKHAASKLVLQTCSNCGSPAGSCPSVQLPAKVWSVMWT